MGLDIIVTSVLHISSEYLTPEGVWMLPGLTCLWEYKADLLFISITLYTMHSAYNGMPDSSKSLYWKQKPVLGANDSEIGKVIVYC